MYMLGLFNTRERTAQDWSVLLKGADESFQLTAIHQQPQSALAVVEVTGMGNDSSSWFWKEMVEIDHFNSYY